MYNKLIHSFWGRTFLGLLFMSFIGLVIAGTISLCAYVGVEIVVTVFLFLFMSILMGELIFHPPIPYDPNKPKSRFPGP